jgi:putative membrane protein
MRKILNFFIVGIVLWLSSLLFPEHIKFSGFPAIVLTTVLIYVVITIVMLAVFGTLALIGVEKIAIWIVCFICFALFSGTATLLIISYLYDGFSVSGFWTAFLLSFCLSLFTTDIKRNQ